MLVDIIYEEYMTPDKSFEIVRVYNNETHGYPDTFYYVIANIKGYYRITETVADLLNKGPAIHLTEEDIEEIIEEGLTYPQIKERYT